MKRFLSIMLILFIAIVIIGIMVDADRKKK